jgi:hypothetical protein
VTTGLWATGGDVRLRRRLVTGWAAVPPADRPGFASVNVSEAGFADLVEALEGAGIEVEVGVWSPPDAEALAAQGRAGGWPRILVEVLGAPAQDAAAAADEILRRLDRLAVTGARLLHGEGPACWPLVAHAGRLGLPTDTTAGPAGQSVADNAELVRLGLAEPSPLP